MAVNKRKVLEAARKYATKGARDKALKEYDTLLKLDPRDAKLRLEIGDVHRRWGQVAEAIETYSKVAEQYMREGFDARAVAVYKQILNLDSGSFACCEQLAELYQRMGLTGEATGALQVAADGFYRSGDKVAALGLLRKMAMLEPSNTTSRLKVADLLHKEGMNDEAVVEYDAVVEELHAQGDAEGVSKVYERLLDVDPDRISSLAGYARNLIDRGEVNHAEPFARRALEADPSPAQYELLGEVLRATGRDAELIELYRQLAELYRELGDEDRTREILQRYISPTGFSPTTEPNGYLDESEMSPAPGKAQYASDGPSSLDELDELGPIDDGRAEFGDENSLIDEDLMADDSQLLGDGESGFGLMTGLDQRDEIPISARNSEFDVNEMTRLIPEDAEPLAHDVDQLFAEASVYLRYGKRDQAVATLESVLAIDPSHRGALEKLGEAFVEADDKVRAVKLWSKAVKLALEDDEIDAAKAIRDRIAAIDAAAAGKLVFEAPMSSQESDPDTEESPIPADLMGDIAVDFGEPLSEIDPRSSESDLEEIEFDDIEIDLDDTRFAVDPTGRRRIEPQAEVTARDSIGEQESEALTFDTSIVREANPRQIGEDIEEADFYLQQGLLDEAEAIYSRVLEVAPHHPHALVRMGEVAAQRGEDPGSSAAGSEPAAPLAARERDVPDEPKSTDIGDELTDWNDDLSLTDEREIGPISKDLALAHSFNEQVAEQEFGVAAFSIGSFDPIDATGDTTGDSDGDTRDLREDLSGEFPDTPAEADIALGADVEIEFDDDFEVDFDLDDSDPDSDDVADETHPPEFVLGLPVDDADAPGESMAAPDVAAPEPAAPELAVTSIDLGENTQEGSEEGSDEGETEPEGDDFGFDLAAEIGQSLDEDPNENTSGNSADTSDDGFAAVFAEFKKGVSETLSEGDFEAHYDLGIAYREMGLLDDAVTEFNAAMASPSRRLGCLHLLGLCALDARQPEDAIAHLQMALDTDDLATEQVLGLRFDLGRCFEQSGDIESATTEYLAVQAVNPKFADVGSRLEGLGDPDKPVRDEIHYESFDDFFKESENEERDFDSDLESESYQRFHDVNAESEQDPSDPEVVLGDAPELAFEDPSELPMGDSPEQTVEQDGAPEILEMEALLEPEAEFEPEPALEIEPEADAEPEFELAPETESEPELPKARKQRKISFF